MRSEYSHLVASMPISSTRAMIQSWFEVHIPNVRENQVSQFPDFSITVSSVINFLLVYIKLTHLIFHALNKIIIMRCDNTSTSMNNMLS